MSSRTPPPKPTPHTERPNPNPIRRVPGPPPTIPGATELKKQSSFTTPKRLIWTGAFAAVTIVASIYGAGLKTKQEYKAEKQQIIETPPEERISTLLAHREHLVHTKRPLEEKLEKLRQRTRDREQGIEPQTPKSMSDVWKTRPLKEDK